MASKTQLSNDNRRKVLALTKASPLSFITNATADTLDAESLPKSKVVEFDNSYKDLSGFLVSKTNKQQIQKKTKRSTNQM